LIYFYVFRNKFIIENSEFVDSIWFFKTQIIENYLIYLQLLFGIKVVATEIYNPAEPSRREKARALAAQVCTDPLFDFAALLPRQAMSDCREARDDDDDMFGTTGGYLCWNNLYFHIILFIYLFIYLFLNVSLYFFFSFFFPELPLRTLKCSARLIPFRNEKSASSATGLLGSQSIGLEDDDDAWLSSPPVQQSAAKSKTVSSLGADDTESDLFRVSFSSLKLNIFLLLFSTVSIDYLLRFL
jgi:hypothetical protein